MSQDQSVAMLCFEAVFCFSLIGVIYSYFIYPITIYFIGFFRKIKVINVVVNFIVTVIIAAHNEENRIFYKIKNTLESDFDKDKIQVIVVSDGSTDKTNDIVLDFPHAFVPLPFAAEFEHFDPVEMGADLGGQDLFGLVLSD